jgi:hypothetical protein
MECAFGIRGDDGFSYAVNLGESAEAVQQFRSGARVTLTGFFVPVEAVSTDQWQKYDMRGIFTVTDMPAPAAAEGKINIDAVCEGALAYMTFPDGAAADAFVAECKEGKHPEVIEEYKKNLNLGDGAAI